MKFLLKKTCSFTLAILGTLILPHHSFGMEGGIEDELTMPTPRGGISQPDARNPAIKQTTMAVDSSPAAIERRRLERIEKLKADRLSKREEKAKKKEEERVLEESKVQVPIKTE